MSKCWLQIEKSATNQIGELIRGMISLTMTFPIVFHVSESVGSKELHGGKTSHDKSHAGCEECWLHGTIRGCGYGMSEPYRWVSVEVDKLTVDHGGGRGKVVSVCSASATFLFTRLHASTRVCLTPNTCRECGNTF